MTCPAASCPTKKTASSAPGVKSVVERHHEPPLGLTAAPGGRDPLQLPAEVGADLAWPQDRDLVAGALDPVDRLPDLADFAPFEREGRRVDDSLIAVVERVQPVHPVERESSLRDAEHRDPPIAAVRVLDEARDERREPGRLADRVTRDDRDAADDTVGEKRLPLRVEEVRLVAPERERRERVDTEAADELLDPGPLDRLLAYPVPPRSQPARDDPDRRADAEQEEAEREPLSERARECGEPCRWRPRSALTISRVANGP